MPRHCKTPMFAKRHYEAIAATCKRVMDEQNAAGRYEDENGAMHLALELALLFGRDNPNFQPERFRKAISRSAT